MEFKVGDLAQPVEGEIISTIWQRIYSNKDKRKRAYHQVVKIGD